MSEQNNTKAWAYLRELLFSAVPAELPVELAENPDFRDFAASLSSIRQAMLALARGDLNFPLPLTGFLAGTLKQLQSNLRHLTWQTKMIASGDFGQKVDFMGDFSSAFNSMVQRLEDTHRALSQMKDFSESIVQNMAEGLAVCDRAGVIELSNQALSDMLGMAVESLPGRHVQELYSEQHSHVPDAADSSMIPNDRLRFEGRLLRQDDKLCTVMVSTAPLESQGMASRRILVFTDITERKRLEDENYRLLQEMERLAITDSLTGVYNRRHFETLAIKELERACRYERPVSLVMLDIDYFKKVNDTFGHLIGDKVLQLVAQTCQRNVRESDIVGRYGGEEFILLLPETPVQSAESMALRLHTRIAGLDAGLVAERLRQKIAETTILADSYTLRVTASMGVSGYMPPSSADPADAAGSRPSACLLEQLVEMADQALYRSKRQGRNQVTVQTDAATSDAK